MTQIKPKIDFRFEPPDHYLFGQNCLMFRHKRPWIAMLPDPGGSCFLGKLQSPTGRNQSDMVILSPGASIVVSCGPDSFPSGRHANVVLALMAAFD